MMTVEELAGYIDLTLLRPDVTRKDMERFLADARRFPFASVCIPPYYIDLACSLSKDIRIGTVVGFPFGYQTKAVKLFEAAEAVRAGACEIDMVMNITAFRSGEWDQVRGEIVSIVAAIPGTTVKVIIEVSCLTDEEKARACELVIDGGAHFVKTSTGFAGGARVEDVALLKRAARGRIKIKASGGIRDLDTTLRMIDAGADRIGTSSGVAILGEFVQRSSIR